MYGTLNFAYGFPFRGQYSWFEYDPAIAGGVGMQRFRGMMILGTWVRLPTGIIWTGFIANTVLYAGLWAAVTVGAVAATRRTRVYLRRKKGCCIHCGYDLRGNTSGTCPECGSATAAAIN